MSQPRPYTPQVSFTGWSQNYPTTPQSGVSLDSEFAAIANTLSDLLNNIAKIQRDDGGLVNQSVGLDQLNAAVLEILSGLSGSIELRGPWVTGNSYNAWDVTTNDGSTYLCFAGHTAGVFSEDLAAGLWITLYSNVSASIADNVVTTAKIADGAVTAPKLGFTALTLSGGVFGGTAGATDGILGGKKAAGDVIGYIGRTTSAQGSVMWRLDGAGSAWDFRQPAGQDYAEFFNSKGGVTTARFETDARTVWYGGMQITGAGNPTAGAGLELSYSAGNGSVRAYDRSLTAYKQLVLDASTITLKLSGVAKATLSPTGFALPAGSSIDGKGIGYSGLPIQSASEAYVLALTDADQCISISAGGVTIPPNVTTPFPAKTAIVIFNNSPTAQPIAIIADTLRWAGSASVGARTLAGYGLAFLFKPLDTTWVISGPGVS